VLVDARAGSQLLYLPLDKIIQMSGSGAASPTALPDALGSTTPRAAPTPDSAPSPAPAPDVSSRSRDALRGRDRTDR